MAGGGDGEEAKLDACALAARNTLREVLSSSFFVDSVSSAMVTADLLLESVAALISSIIMVRQSICCCIGANAGGVASAGVGMPGERDSTMRAVALITSATWVLTPVANVRHRRVLQIWVWLGSVLSDRKPCSTRSLRADGSSDALCPSKAGLMELADCLLVEGPLVCDTLGGTGVMDGGGLPLLIIGLYKVWVLYMVNRRGNRALGGLGVVKSQGPWGSTV